MLISRFLRNFIFCSIFMILSFHAYSQSSSSLDEDFLTSLPESVQKELQEDSEEGEKPVERLLNSKTSSLKNKEILKILQKQLSVLEDRMKSEDEKMFTPLERFGTAFFNSSQSTFMPVNVPNLNADYILDVGDKLSLTIVGSNPIIIDDLLVDRDGSLTIEEFGKVFIAGKNFSEAQVIVDSFIQGKSIGNEVYLTLSELRDIQVIMLGGLNNPGIYTISGGSNPLHALNVAGGINDNGSFRNISIKRAGQDISTLDLYDTLLLGNTNILERHLRSGDTIFVHPVDFFVPISGGVNNPAIFDLKQGESLSNLINFAGGFSQDNFNLGNVILERDNGFGINIQEITKKELPNIVLQPRDSIVVPMYSREMKSSPQITISGAVKRPGKYNIQEGATLSEIILRAGGYKKDAYEFGGMFLRKSVQELDKAFGKRIYADTINFLVSNLGQGAGGGGSQQPLTGDFLKILIEESQSQDIIGRVIVDFDLNAMKSNASSDVKLQDKDVIEIPFMPEHVYLFGDFNQPVTLPYNPEYNLNDYIELAAGKKSSATQHLILIDPNGMSHYYQKPRFSILERQHDIYPGSIIYLPRELGKVEGVMFAAAVAPILSSLTLSLASINSITND
jgi:protein involved in polysaccharide export with SLBB domain